MPKTFLLLLTLILGKYPAQCCILEKTVTLLCNHGTEISMKPLLEMIDQSIKDHSDSVDWCCQSVSLLTIVTVTRHGRLIEDYRFLLDLSKHLVQHVLPVANGCQRQVLLGWMSEILRICPEKDLHRHGRDLLKSLLTDTQDALFCARLLLKRKWNRYSEFVIPLIFKRLSTESHLLQHSDWLTLLYQMSRETNTVSCFSELFEKYGIHLTLSKETQDDLIIVLSLWTKVKLSSSVYESIHSFLKQNYSNVTQLNRVDGLLVGKCLEILATEPSSQVYSQDLILNLCQRGHQMTSLIKGAAKYLKAKGQVLDRAMSWCSCNLLSGRKALRMATLEFLKTTQDPVYTQALVIEELKDSVETVREKSLKLRMLANQISANESKMLLFYFYGN
jgi:hypothetical protein